MDKIKMSGDKSIKNIKPAEILTALFFISFFTLSSTDLKYNLIIIYVSPVVIIPIIIFLFSAKVRKFFLNEHIHDRNFKFTYFSVALFTILMFVQTIFSEWQIRAISELLKTSSFFLITHLFYAVFANTKRLNEKITFSIFFSVLFLFYLSYLYLIKFGVIFIGNNLSSPDPTGRNTLTLYIFACVILTTGSFGSLTSKYTFIIKYSLLSFLFVIAVFTGSRFGAVFSVLFFIFMMCYQFAVSLKVTSKFYLLSTILFIVCFCYLFFASTSISNNVSNIPYYAYLESYSQITGAKSGGDSKRLTLLAVGTSCFLDNGILLGHGVKDYLSCVSKSSIGSDLILHNDHLSILNNVGLIGYVLWLFSIVIYTRLFACVNKTFVYRIGVLTYLLGLFVVDGYNSPVFSILLALARIESFECSRSDKGKRT